LGGGAAAGTAAGGAGSLAGTAGVTGTGLLGSGGTAAATGAITPAAAGTAASGSGIASAGGAGTGFGSGLGAFSPSGTLLSADSLGLQGIAQAGAATGTETGAAATTMDKALTWQDAYNAISNANKVRSLVKGGQDAAYTGPDQVTENRTNQNTMAQNQAPPQNFSGMSNPQALQLNNMAAQAIMEMRKRQGLGAY
jgi:hypothetical protein